MKKGFLFFYLLVLVIPIRSFAIGTTPPWQSNGVVIKNDTWENPDVVQVDSDMYRMYYAQNGSIYSATSGKGKVWTTEDGVRVSQAGPAMSVLRLSDGTWRMYFTRSLNEKLVLYSALSQDGLSFVEEEGIRLEAGHPKGYDGQSGIVHPSAIQTYNGKVRVYYDTFNTSDGGDDPWRILSAISDDGLNFTVESGIRINPEKDMPKGTQSTWSPFVRKKKGTYYLYFGSEYDTKPLTRNGIYVAKSINGMDFLVDPEPLIFRDPDLGNAINSDKGMNGAPQDPSVMRIEGKLRIFFWIVDKGILRATYNK